MFALDSIRAGVYRSPDPQTDGDGAAAADPAATPPPEKKPEQAETDKGGQAAQPDAEVLRRRLDQTAAELREAQEQTAQLRNTAAGATRFYTQAEEAGVPKDILELARKSGMPKEHIRKQLLEFFAPVEGAAGAGMPVTAASASPAGLSADEVRQIVADENYNAEINAMIRQVEDAVSVEAPEAERGFYKSLCWRALEDAGYVQKGQWMPAGPSAIRNAMAKALQFRPVPKAGKAGKGPTAAEAAAANAGPADIPAGGSAGQSLDLSNRELFDKAQSDPELRRKLAKEMAAREMRKRTRGNVPATEA